MNKKLSTGLMLLLGLLLIVGMVVQFTPSIGGIGGLSSLLSGATGKQGTPAIKVGTQTITAEELQQLRQNNPLLNFTQSGTLGDDLKRVTVAAKLQSAYMAAGSAGQDVSRQEVSDKVNEVRKAQNLTENKAWVDRLAQMGYTDASYRQTVRDSLAIQKQEKVITDAAPKPTDAEIQQYYDLNNAQFMSETRIIGREIVVADKAKAAELLTQLKGGADFSTLATQNSLEFKDRGGALGPVTNGKPAPALVSILPTDVAAAVSTLQNGGLSNVIASQGKFYILKVEEYLPPAVKPLSEVKAQVSDAVLKAKQNAALENWLDGLKKSNPVQYLDPAWKVTDPTVATVNGTPIPYSELLMNVVGNQSFQGLLQQVPADKAGAMVNQFLKPGAAEQLIAQYAAPLIVKANNLNLVGPRAMLAQQLMSYGSRDVTVSNDDVIKAYQTNIAQYTTHSAAAVSEAAFTDKQQALAFQRDFDGKDFVQAASKAGGTVSERGTVTQGDPNSKLSPAMSKAVFDAGDLRQVTGGALSDVVEQGKTYNVAYVTNLVRGTVQPLAQVRAAIEQQLKDAKRAQVGAEYLKGQMSSLKIQNNLAAVLAQQEKEVAAAAKAAPAATPNATTPSAATPAPATK